MFLLNLLQPGSPRQQSWHRRITHGVFTLIFVSFLSLALLFTGCDTEADDASADDHKLNQNLIGTWTSEFSDSYIITENEISYDMGFGFGGYAGTIEYVSNFSNTAGVIIIKYKAGQEQTYPIYDENWNITGYHERPGDYVGIYYEDFKPGVSVQVGTSINITDYTGAETQTLNEAKSRFTKGKKGNYIGTMGIYSK
ncbi:MAG: hypothetical protein FWC24_07145 [Treponema sp.]|nr:hypothetical protein [Treponema sp.]